MKHSKWFMEHFSDYEIHMHGIKNYLLSEKTKYQLVEVAQTYQYGKCLFLDNRMQSSELDEFIYHELLVHPALLTNPNPKKVLIIGGGEGATLREVLRHNTVEDAIMVDIDEQICRICKSFLNEWHQGAFDDPRVKLLHLDARKYLEERKTKFDAIIIDLTEPIEGGPSYLLFTKEFYSTVNKRLADDGVLSMQAGSANITDYELHTAIVNTLKKIFPHVYSYNEYVPSFDSAWSFALASKKIDPIAISREQIDNAIKKRLNSELKYYDGLTHQGVFILPKNMRNALAKATAVITDDNPMLAKF